MTVVDLRGRVYEPDAPKRPDNVKLITKIDRTRFQEIFKKFVLAS
jgi:hypothetical protein